MTHTKPTKEAQRLPNGKYGNKKKQSIIIHGGAMRLVVVPTCSNCGADLKKVKMPNIDLRFRCPECNQSIENTRENRCRVCNMLCSDSETYNGHKWGGCPHAGQQYPNGARFRPHNPKVPA